jgi:glycosyltransferase involved in cell wall biosynthesis
MKIKWGRVSLIFDDNSIPLPLLYLLQKFSVVELIFNIEEWPLSHNIKLVHKIILHWFVIFAFSVCKKTVCISSYLVERAKYYNKHIAVYKLPALTKFDDFKDQGLILDKIENRHTKFLFCGNTGYLEVIWLIIHSYENFCLLKPLENVKLVLILHGNEMIIRKLSQYINKSKYSIKLLSSLTESELFEQYDQATVLLAPLRPTIQDNARFPQKIAEYTAMSKPIITTNVGDIELYFDSNESAIFMGEFSIEELSQKMIFSVENKEKIRLIGMKGNIAGRKFFNYKQYVTSFGNFIKY